MTHAVFSSPKRLLLQVPRVLHGPHLSHVLHMAYVLHAYFTCLQVLHCLVTRQYGHETVLVLMSQHMCDALHVLQSVPQSVLQS